MKRNSFLIKDLIASEQNCGNTNLNLEDSFTAKTISKNTSYDNRYGTGCEMDTVASCEASVYTTRKDTINGNVAGGDRMNGGSNGIETYSFTFAKPLCKQSVSDSLLDRNCSIESCTTEKNQLIKCYPDMRRYSADHELSIFDVMSSDSLVSNLLKVPERSPNETLMMVTPYHRCLLSNLLSHSENRKSELLKIKNKVASCGTLALTPTLVARLLFDASRKQLLQSDSRSAVEFQDKTEKNMKTFGTSRSKLRVSSEKLSAQRLKAFQAGTGARFYRRSIQQEISLGKKSRRARTVFSDTQLSGLEKRFDAQKYLSTPDRLDLAEELGLSQLQVKTWYQNRRMKWKKQVMQGGLGPPTKPKGRPKKDSIPTLAEILLSLHKDHL